MSNYVYDEDGFVGDFATNKGQTDFFNYLSSLNNPDLAQFIKDGYATVPEALLEILEKYDPPRGELKDTMDNFKQLLGKCKGIVIISDGMNDGLGEEVNREESNYTIDKSVRDGVEAERPQCSKCEWSDLTTDRYVCPAYPSGVPADVVWGVVKHNTVLSDQQGDKIFTPIGS